MRATTAMCEDRRRQVEEWEADGKRTSEKNVCVLVFSFFNYY